MTELIQTSEDLFQNNKIFFEYVPITYYLCRREKVIFKVLKFVDLQTLIKGF